MMRDREDADQFRFNAIVDGERIALQRDRARVAAARDAKFRELEKQGNDSSDFRFERAGLGRSRFSEVPPNGCYELVPSCGLELGPHRLP